MLVDDLDGFGDRDGTVVLVVTVLACKLFKKPHQKKDREGDKF